MLLRQVNKTVDVVFVIES